MKQKDLIGLKLNPHKAVNSFFKIAREDAINNGAICRVVGGQNTGGSTLSCVDAVEDALQKNPQKLAENVSKIGKFKNVALGFLKSPGLRTFGIACTVGAVGAQVVKEFRNDDPTSYLSNEDQQKSMLVAMATDPITTEFDRPAILDYQLPALGATVAGATALGAPSTIKASRSRALGVEKKGLTRTGARVLGRGLGIAATPGALLPFAAADLAGQIAEGDSAVDIATDPINYIAPIFADQTDKITRGLNPTLRKLSRLNLGKAALRGISRGGIAGLGLSLGIEGLRLLDD